MPDGPLINVHWAVPPPETDPFKLVVAPWHVLMLFPASTKGNGLTVTAIEFEGVELHNPSLATTE